MFYIERLIILVPTNHKILLFKTSKTIYVETPKVADNLLIAVLRNTNEGEQFSFTPPQANTAAFSLIEKFFEPGWEGNIIL